MKEPRRLREENRGPVVRALLDAASSYRSSPATRAKTLTGLGLAGSAALSAGAVSASSSVFAKLGLAKLLAVSALGAAVVVPAGYYVLHHRDDRSPASAMAATSVARTATLPAATTPRQSSAALADEPALLPVPVAPAEASRRSARATAARVRLTTRPAKPSAPARAPATAPSAAPADTPTEPASTPTVPAPRLSAELTALDAARATLAKGDPTAALAALDGYARAFPGGRLELEAEVLRIDAMSMSGHSDLARKRAAIFLARHPESVLAPRVRDHLSN